MSDENAVSLTKRVRTLYLLQRLLTEIPRFPDEDSIDVMAGVCALDQGDFEEIAGSLVALGLEEAASRLMTKFGEASQQAMLIIGSDQMKQEPGTAEGWRRTHGLPRPADDDGVHACLQSDRRVTFSSKLDSLRALIQGFIDTLQPDSPEDERLWLTVTDAARACEENPGAITRAANKGEIVTNGNTGKDRRVDSQSVVGWKLKMEQKREQAPKYDTIRRKLNR